MDAHLYLVIICMSEREKAKKDKGSWADFSRRVTDRLHRTRINLPGEFLVVELGKRLQWTASLCCGKRMYGRTEMSDGLSAASAGVLAG